MTHLIGGAGERGGLVIAMAVAVVAVCQGKESEERQGLVPGTDLAAA